MPEPLHRTVRTGYCILKVFDTILQFQLSLISKKYGQSAEQPTGPYRHGRRNLTRKAVLKPSIKLHRSGSHEAKGGPNQLWLSWLCICTLSPPLNRLSWRRLVLKGGTILEEREKERKFGSSGFERGTWWMSTSLGPHPENSVDSNWRPVDEHRKKERKNADLCTGRGSN